MEGDNNKRPQISKDLLYSGGDEQSKLFVADGKDRLNPKPPEITRLPASSVLAKARAFLPMMAAANKQLQHAMATNPESVNIENVEEGKPYVQMKLSFLGEEPEGEQPSGSSDDDSDDSSESESEEGEKETETTGATASKRRRIIEEIGGHDQPEDAPSTDMESG